MRAVEPTAAGSVDLTPQLEEVAPGVYSYVQPDGTWFVNNAGFVVGDESVVAVDATSTERRTRAYLDAIASVTDLPVGVLVNTHHHADHTHGNFLFDDAVVVSHRACRDAMVAAGIPDYGAVFPGVDWGELTFRAPDVTFETGLTLHAGSLGTVELAHVGFVAHTAGDVLAWVPQRGVLFAGDLVFHGGTPFVLFGSVSGTLAALDLVQGYDADVVVPGHGPTFGRGDVARVLDGQRDYLRFVQDGAAAGLAAGRSPLEQARATDLGEFARLTDSERLAANLHVAYREAGGDEGGAAGGAGGGAAGPASLVEQGIADMVAYNGGALPRCVA